MATNEKVIELSNRVKSIKSSSNPETNHIVAGADDIFDDSKRKKQSTINQETDEALNDRYTKEETYSKSQLNNMVAPQHDYITVATYADLSNLSEHPIGCVYRVSNYDGTNSQVDATKYSEYSFDGTQYIHLATKSQIGEVFDISAYHATGGTLATYANLSAALDSNNGGGVPQSLQNGGMSVKFVRSSDNKYVQFRYMGTEITGTPNPFLDTANWAIVDEGVCVENPEFVYVKTDAEDKILFAIKTDGSIYLGAGVPQPVIDYIEKKIAELPLDEYEDIVAFLNDLEKGDKTLRTLLNEKVDKEEGKSLIDADYASSQSAVENPEYLSVEIDLQDKVLGGRRIDGTKFENCDYETPFFKIFSIDSPEYIDVLLDGNDRIIKALRKDGRIIYGKGVNPAEVNKWIVEQINNIKYGTDSNTLDAVDKFTSFLAGFTTDENLKDIIDNIDIAVNIAPLSIELGSIPLNGNNKFNSSYEFPTLWAIKYDNSRTPVNGYAKKSHPVPIGWLYFDSDDKVYYSSQKGDDFQYLFTWDRTIADNYSPDYYNAVVCNNGDIVCIFRNEKVDNSARRNPLIYKASDYANPVEISITGTKPTGFLSSSNMEYITEDNYFIFPEYTRPYTEPANCWKVTYPFDEPTNWRIVKATTGTGSGTRQVEHFHSVDYDFYDGRIYLSSGDSADESKIWYSDDDGETWTVALENSVNACRALNLIFTEHNLFYGSDNTGTLNIVDRGNDGHIDFSTWRTISWKSVGENVSVGRTYHTVLIDKPFGILCLQRSESTSHPYYDSTVYFYDIPNERQFEVLRMQSLENVPYPGFRCCAVNVYQGLLEKRIFCGFGLNSGTSKEHNNFDVLGNNSQMVLHNMFLSIK